MPISQKQLEANRKNALKSTGPKTAKGKTASSQNSLKHGLTAMKIIFSSSHNSKEKSEFESLVKNLTNELKPQSIFQNYLVHKIAVCIWRNNIIVNAETAQINKQLNNIENNYKLQKLQNQLDQYSNENIPLKLEKQYKQELSNLIGINTIPNSKSSSTLLKYEQHIDTQLIRTYKLLRQIQIEGHFQSLQNRYKKK